ncbi:hypothetical protein SAMN06295960_2280 [Paenibacillus aquistagni]|uniref:Uncharacterized protein n=1 Tax=Paenibacillus aquistagni TaxID=1852522 RepID=A0A1X7KAI1_9BACL|nr:hypothetical protein SAMN06295960_2280 [Paenibacillus aquistagni]
MDDRFVLKITDQTKFSKDKQELSHPIGDINDGKGYWRRLKGSLAKIRESSKKM